MKVKIVKPVSIKINGSYWNLKKDQTYDVPDDSGKTILNRGYGFAVVDSPEIPEIFPQKSTTKTIVVEEPAPTNIVEPELKPTKPVRTKGKKTLKELMEK